MSKQKKNDVIHQEIDDLGAKYGDLNLYEDKVSGEIFLDIDISRGSGLAIGQTCLVLATLPINYPAKEATFEVAAPFLTLKGTLGADTTFG